MRRDFFLLHEQRQGKFEEFCGVENGSVCLCEQDKQAVLAEPFNASGGGLDWALKYYFSNCDLASKVLYFIILLSLVKN